MVRGRVQGVGYRATTLDEARRLGLTTADVIDLITKDQS